MTAIRPFVGKGHIVQVRPDADPEFGGCLVVVSEVKSWGIVGYVSLPGSSGGVEVYVRVPYANLVATQGQAPYVLGPEFEGMGVPIEVLNEQAEMGVALRAPDNDDDCTSGIKDV